MSSLAFPNEYNLRTVADAASKPCFVCQFKVSTKVLVTSDNKDFFYACPSHLTDRGFASPIVDEKAEAEKKKQEELAKEKAAVIKEYEEKTKKKGKEAKKKDDPVKTAEEEKDEKLKALDAKAEGGATTEDGPRRFVLHRNFYQMRLDRKAQIERAKKEQARINTPGLFPAAPSGNLGH